MTLIHKTALRQFTFQVSKYIQYLHLVLGIPSRLGLLVPWILHHVLLVVLRLVLAVVLHLVLTVVLHLVLAVILHLVLIVVLHLVLAVVLHLILVVGLCPVLAVVVHLVLVILVPRLGSTSASIFLKYVTRS